MKNKKNKKRKESLSLFLKISRWVVSVLLIIIIVFTIVLSIPLVSVSQTITSRDNIKTFLEQSGIYEDVLGVIFKMMSIEESGGEQVIAFDEIIEKIVSPEHAKKNIEGAIDGIFDWLEGKTDRPIFELSVLPEGVDLTDYFLESVTDLSECEEGESFSLREENSFELTCRPKGFNIEDFDVFGLSVGQIENYFSGLKIKSVDFPIDSINSKKIQGAFFFLKYSPIFLGLYIIVLLALLVLAMPGFEKGRGFIAVGIAIFVPSVLLLVASVAAALLKFAFVINFVMGLMPGEIGSILISLFRFIELIYLEMVARVGYYSLVLILLGVILFIMGMVMRSKAVSKEKKGV